jgi:hypothetical protein
VTAAIERLFFNPHVTKRMEPVSPFFVVASLGGVQTVSWVIATHLLMYAAGVISGLAVLALAVAYLKRATD